jgi:hypothetical protein
MNRLIQEIERSTFPVVFKDYMKKILNIFIKVIETKFENGYSHSCLMSIIQGHLCGPRIIPCLREDEEMPISYPTRRLIRANYDSSDSDSSDSDSSNSDSSDSDSSDSDSSDSDSSDSDSSDSDSSDSDSSDSNSCCSDRYRPKQRCCYIGPSDINDNQRAASSSINVNDDSSDVPEFLKNSNFKGLL